MEAMVRRLLDDPAAFAEREPPDKRVRRVHYACSECGASEPFFDDHQIVCAKCGVVQRTRFIEHPVAGLAGSRVRCDASQYKRVTYLREKLSCWMHTDVAVPYRDMRAICDAAVDWFSTPEGAPYRKGSAAGLRVLKEEVKTILVRAGVSVKKYLEKWRRLAHHVQPWAKIPPRPTYEIYESLCDSYTQVCTAWDATWSQHPSRASILSVNFVVLQLLLMQSQYLYDMYKDEWPLPKNDSRTRRFWAIVCAYNGWQMRLPVVSRA